MAVRAYARLLRLPAVFTAWADIAAAQLIATGGALDSRLFVLLLASSSAFYLAGMALNDCFDLQEDRRERPQRPLPAGEIPPVAAWALGWGLLLAGLALAALAGPRSLLIGLGLAAAIVAYDGGLKRLAVGSLAMGACRYLNWLLGLSVLPLAAGDWLMPLPIFIYVTALTGLSRMETTAHSRLPVLACMLGLLATAAAVALLYGLQLLETTWALAPGALLLLVLLHALRGLDRALTPARVQQTVKLLLLAIIPLDAVMAFAGGPWWGGLAVLLLLVPGRLLARVVYIT